VQEQYECDSHPNNAFDSFSESWVLVDARKQTKLQLALGFHHEAAEKRSVIARESKSGISIF
jgi:hypothetical protein